MRKYELVIILKPDLNKSEQEKIIKKMSKIITDLKGKVNKKDIWGKKNMAYPIKKQKQGTYVKLNISLPEDKIGDWREKIQLEDNIIRHLLIKT